MPLRIFLPSSEYCNSTDKSLFFCTSHILPPVRARLKKKAIITQSSKPNPEILVLCRITGNEMFPRVIQNYGKRDVSTCHPEFRKRGVSRCSGYRYRRHRACREHTHLQIFHNFLAVSTVMLYSVTNAEHMFSVVITMLYIL
jgi:hypothetical protein